MSGSQSSSGLGLFAVVIVSVLTSALVSVAVLWTSGLPVPLLGQAAAPTEPVDTTPRPTETKEYSQVPSLMGLPTPAAIEVLKARDLRMIVKSKRTDDSAPKGTIVEQDPLPESQVEKNGAVSVILSTGQGAPMVPQVIGKPMEEAKQLIESAGLRVGPLSATGKGAPGTVTGVEPMPGTEVQKGTKISIVFTPAQIEIPKVVGMNKNKAKEELEKLGFKVGKFRWRYNEDKRANIVLSQKPDMQTLAEPGSEVILVINEE